MTCNNDNNNKLIILIMGVSGSGKTTIGKGIAEKLNCGFNDADEFHSEANINKMKSGIPLNDDDRKPWLEAINKRMTEFLNNSTSITHNHVFTCSALKSIYREIISNSIPKDKILFIFLKGDKEILGERLNSRQGHFFNPALLDSQLEALQEPNDQDLKTNHFLTINIRSSVDEIINNILKFIKDQFNQ
ncbi:hypothetical protein DICPUDRAFT_76935 [Dictyostelium purpureum]|uniref:Gluconokinase n=1 Tax=Dictyostelium purpureum TaxID=5786 RepID=F0ZF39_DICPU|nr:uncharacterized protein DICPUDRAFT_76935 [Dictyostelium purpureum]EGC37452.1 hypothetical protein DICPUDRAFT_76935 [Dictyostelium purpureum]|eukprot:XP_003286016.1 hypothetical protein DICPUDRAFT_76935 [Dictyostelium purpureum]